MDAKGTLWYLPSDESWGESMHINFCSRHFESHGTSAMESIKSGSRSMQMNEHGQDEEQFGHISTRVDENIGTFGKMWTEMGGNGYIL